MKRLLLRRKLYKILVLVSYICQSISSKSLWVLKSFCPFSLPSTWPLSSWDEKKEIRLLRSLSWNYKVMKSGTQPAVINILKWFLNVDLHLLKFNMLEKHELQTSSYEYEQQMKTWLKVAISSILHLNYLASFWVMLSLGLEPFVTVFRASYYSSFWII